MILPRNASRSARRRKLKQRKSGGLDYLNLEPRQLLAVDIGVNFTGSTFLTDSSAIVPDAQGEISADYAVEVANGRFLVHNRFTGTRLLSQSLNQFFVDAGATLFSNPTNPRVVFDELSNRFFVAATSGEGLGNWIHIAFSDTDDPTGPWQSLQFVGDSTATHFNGDLSLAVDADAVYLTTNNVAADLPNVVDDVSIYSIPKADMFLANPTLTNMSRFEGLDPEVYGTTIQVASNFEASDGMAVAVGSIDVATKVMIEIYDTDGPGATISEAFEFNVDFGLIDTHEPGIPHDTGGPGEIFREPDTPWQLQDEDFALDIKFGLVGSITEINGSIFAVQTVSLEEVENHTSLNWFELDVATRAVAGSTPITPEDDGNLYQTIRDGSGLDPYAVGLRGPASHLIRPENGSGEFRYLFNPSIAVTQEGLVAIGYNRLSGNEPVGTGVAVGIAVNGLNRRNFQFETDFEIQNGFEIYNLNTLDTDPWGRYGSVQVDPLSSNGFYLTQPWANTTSRWSVQNTLIELVDMNPIIEANRENNTIVVRRMASNPDMLEVEIDGQVTDVLPYSLLGRVEIWGGDGSDTFLIDYTNGDPTPAGGFLFDGGVGPDKVETNKPDGAEFLMVQPNHPTFANNYPDYLSTYQTRFGDDGGVSDGFYDEISEMVDIEELVGGPGPDTFIFQDGWIMDGSAFGGEGDDTFRFIDSGMNVSGVEASIVGGPGYDTLDFEQLSVTTHVELVRFGENGGFDGRLVGDEPGDILAIGGRFAQSDDLFIEIERLIGSSEFREDSLTVWNDRPGEWFIDDGDSYYLVEDDEGLVRRLDFSDWNVINASMLDDVFNIRSNTLDYLALNAMEGDDEFNFSSTAPALDGNSENIELLFVNAGEGANRINATNLGGSAVDALVLRNRVTGLGDFAYQTSGGGTIAMELWGSPFADRLSLHSYFATNSLVVRSGAGDDVFSIQDLSKASIEVYGEEGDDTYMLEQIQNVSFRNLFLIDSVGAEMDRIVLAGTSAAERFVVTEDLFVDLEFDYTGIEALGIDGRAGNDIFEILNYSGDIFILGGDGNDSFFFSSDGETLLGDLTGFVDANISIDGGRGANRLALSEFANPMGMNATVRESSIEGLWTGSFEYLSTGGSFSVAGGYNGIRMIGSDLGNDRFDARGLLRGNTLTLEGLGGDDTFFVRAATEGNVRTNGQTGSDNHNIVFGQADNRRVDVVDDAGGGSNRISLYGTDNDDTFGVFSGAVQFATEMAMMSGGFVTLSVFARGGNDQMDLSGTPAGINRFFGEDGDDTFNALGTLGATGLRVLLGEGSDRANILDALDTTFTRVLGDAGDDLITIGQQAKGTVIADGEAGSDQYEVALTGDEARYVKTLDSGVGEMDIVTIFGSDEADLIDVRTARINQSYPSIGTETVVFGAENELLIVNTAGGDDTVQVYGSTTAATRIQTGAGADTVHVNSTSEMVDLTIDVGTQNDTVNVYKTAATTNVSIFGQAGDDQFSVGSDMASDNGNLGRLRGQLAIYGGDSSFGGEDSLYINDRSPAAIFAYGLSPTALVAVPGPFNVSRPTFNGIQFDSTMEFVRLDTTDLANYISVEPSSSTRFYIDGNDPNDGSNPDQLELLGDPSDGRELTIEDEMLGIGHWDFGPGIRDVAFENIELTFDGT